MKKQERQSSVFLLGLAGAAVFLAGCAQTQTPAAAGASGATATPVSAQAATRPDTVSAGKDPAALQRLKEMGQYLRTLQAFSVTAQSTTDEVLDTGQKVQFGGSIEYRVVAPDKLRAALRSDRVWRDLYYDGKTLTQVAPRAEYYASVPMTGTVGAMVANVSDVYGIEVPLSDLFTWGTSDDGASKLASAYLVGPSRINGVDCDHYAMRQDGVDWQVWIQKGAQPLPRKFVITTTGEPSQPQYTAVLNWNLQARPATSEFTYRPTKTAQRITLAKAGPVAAQ